MDKRIALVVNDYDERAVDAAACLREWCADKGVSIQSLKDNDSHELNSDDLVVALGGDGTILRAAHETSSSEVPILGIKFGRLGFLSGAPADELIEAVEAALAGEAEIEKRALLQVNAYSADVHLGTYYALNEAILGRHTESPVATTHLIINGHSVYQLRGDGIIVATATGSTAYALSAGGPILSPESKAMALVPLASHTLISRAIVTASKDVVRIELSDETHAGVTLAIDGEVVIDNVYPERSKPHTDLLISGEYLPLTHIEVQTSDQHWVSLVKTSSRLFFNTLATEFYRHKGSD